MNPQPPVARAEERGEGGTAVLAEDLHKHFGGTRAVDGLSLRIAQGEIYGLVGPDGAGKTTVMRLLCGVLAPTAGRMEVAGYALPGRVEQARLKIGYLPQRFSLYEEMTVLENLRFFAEVRGIPSGAWHPRSMEILAFVGLAEYAARRAGQLSGGMKQKLGLAAALVHRPRVLLLDEPTTGVDPVTRQSFWQLIIRLVAEESIALLVSTPYMDEAGRCNRVGFLRSGKLLLQGRPTELRARLQGRILEVVGRPLPLLRRLAAADPDVEDSQMFGDRLHLRIKAGGAAGVTERLRAESAKRETTLAGIRPIRPGLEDVFISLLEEKE